MSPNDTIGAPTKNTQAHRTSMITLVSGLPRSGTSMMMKVLLAGGLPILLDDERPADASNPKGYFEFQRVKNLEHGDDGWMELAQGKAVKVISALLKYLPSKYSYRVIFMQRAMAEVLASQRQMVNSRAATDVNCSDDQLTELFQKHLAAVETWLTRQPNIQTIFIHYNEILVNPRPNMEQIQQFLEIPLDLDRMVNAVDNSLYRQRASME